MHHVWSPGILCSYYWCVANNCIMGHSAQHHHQEQYSHSCPPLRPNHILYSWWDIWYSLSVFEAKQNIWLGNSSYCCNCIGMTADTAGTAGTAGCSHIHAGDGENVSRKLLLPASQPNREAAIPSQIGLGNTAVVWPPPPTTTWPPYTPFPSPSLLLRPLPYFGLESWNEIICVFTA